MKKWLVGVGVLAALTTMLVGCDEKPEVFQEKSYAVSLEEADSLTIEVKDRKIEILPSEEEEIHITYWESEKELYQLEQSDAKELRMTSADSKSWYDYIGGNSAPENRIIQVRVPDGALKNLTLQTSNEDILVQSLSVAEKAEIQNNNGDIMLDQLNVGEEAVLKTKNGDLSGSIIGGYDDFCISSDVKKGNSNLPASKEGGAKKLSVSANNGDIQLEFVKP